MPEPAYDPERILLEVAENTALIEMAVEADADAKANGTTNWPTLEELEREFESAPSGGQRRA